MDIKHYRIPLLKPWVALPAPGTLIAPEKDTAALFKETLPETIEFDENSLRALALANKTGLPSIAINASYFDQLPVGFLRTYYEHLRYEAPLPDGWLALRSGSQFVAGVHRLAAYVIMERIIQKLVNDYAMSTDPESKYKARNMHLLAVKLRYLTATTLVANPTVSNPGHVIVSSYLEVVGKTDVTETRHIFFDDVTLAQYEASGKTVNDAIDWYLTQGTQPTV